MEGAALHSAGQVAERADTRQADLPGGWALKGAPTRAEASVAAHTIGATVTLREAPDQ